ncbi:unnamed protein product [Cuscuta campestris]|uniref:poly(A)-specific ribonuclease n=1 Tax=Cuscuta campestris TaxID=132261 RepID=A0A484KKJ9_9ASTE|nr:unnamed protein product [Cuscuta campestris]
MNHQLRILAMEEREEEAVEIRDVWGHNLEAEFGIISNIVDDYPYIAMDTEFPGVVVQACGGASLEQLGRTGYNYRKMKDNVEILKLIQVGLTFSDAEGNLPTLGTGRGHVWQFNFREFDPEADPHAHDSVEMLRECGTDFRRNKTEGVSSDQFYELLVSSGAVLNPDVQWVTFHGSSDFGYLVQGLTGTKRGGEGIGSLPETQGEFLKLVKLFFPVFYDVKHVIRACNDIYGGLARVAGDLGVKRAAGNAHQAGSDSLLTSRVFFKLKATRPHLLLDHRYAGVLYDLDP